MSTKLGNAGLYSDNFATPGWDKDTSPWSSGNMTAGASCVQSGTEISLGFTGNERRWVWATVMEAPYISQSFTDNNWSVEVKVTGSIPTDGQEIHLLSYQSDSSAISFVVFNDGGLRMAGGNYLAIGGPFKFNNFVGGTVTYVPFFINLRRTTADEYTWWYKQDEGDSWIQLSTAETYSITPTEVRLCVANDAVSTPHTQTFDYFYETAAGDPGAEGAARRVLVR